MREEKGVSILTVALGGLAIIVLFILALMFGVPVYSVWQQEYVGRATLAKAEQTRQVIVAQANSEREAAKARAEAIAIMGEAAKKYPEYRHQEFIGAFAEALKEGKISQIIYVPTEANIPILEAGKR
jgi:regulator of protease activity HflC (stomatin/prohibitin superfamily)